MNIPFLSEDGCGIKLSKSLKGMLMFEPIWKKWQAVTSYAFGDGLAPTEGDVWMATRTTRYCVHPPGLPSSNHSPITSPIFDESLQILSSIIFPLS